MDKKGSPGPRPELVSQVFLQLILAAANGAAL